LELLTGASMGSMQIELRDKDQEPIKWLKDDSMTLAQLGVEDGMNVHVMDASNKEEDENPAVTFELSAEDYAKREGLLMEKGDILLSKKHRKRLITRRGCEINLLILLPVLRDGT
jgi:hypothetical protein